VIALDTNVLVRYLVDDDAQQGARAAALIHRAIDADDALFVSDVVVCETVWVLAISYRVGRVEIGSLLRDLFRARHRRYAAVDQLVRALDAFEKGKAISRREHARAADCDVVATFDKALLNETGFAAVR